MNLQLEKKKGKKTKSAVVFHNAVAMTHYLIYRTIDRKPLKFNYRLMVRKICYSGVLKTLPRIYDGAWNLKQK